MSRDYRISTATSEMDVDAIHSFLSRSYWAKAIPRKTVEIALYNSLCFGVFQDNNQVGFARAITDSATFAYLADVYILESHRGRGLGKRLMEEVIAHPDLQGLRRMLLATLDAHTLYTRFGFTALANPDVLMECCKPDMHTRA